MKYEWLGLSKSYVWFSQLISFYLNSEYFRCKLIHMVLSWGLSIPTNGTSLSFDPTKFGISELNFYKDEKQSDVTCRQFKMGRGKWKLISCLFPDRIANIQSLRFLILISKKYLIDVEVKYFQGIHMKSNFLFIVYHVEGESVVSFCNSFWLLFCSGWVQEVPELISLSLEELVLVGCSLVWVVLLWEILFWVCFENDEVITLDMMILKVKVIVPTVIVIVTIPARTCLNHVIQPIAISSATIRWGK